MRIDVGPAGYGSAGEFLASCGTLQSRAAIMAPGRVPLSFEDLFRHAASTVSLLNRLGFGRNDRIAVVLPNGPELAVALLSVIAGFTCVPLSSEYRQQEYERFLSDVKAQALIVLKGIHSTARTAASSLNIPVIDLIPHHHKEAGLFDLEFTGKVSGHDVQSGFALPDDYAVIAHSSGTTSRPKLIPWQQQELFSAAHAVCTAFQLKAADRCLNVMPLYHLHGLISCLLASLYSRGSIVCTKRFDTVSFFNLITEHKPTWYSGVSAIHHAVLKLAERNPEKAKHAGLRFIRHSSTPLSPAVLKKLEESFNAPVIEVYGMTEITPVTINPMDPLKRKQGSAGLSVGPDIAITDHKGRLLPPGQEGEIVISLRHIVKGCMDEQVIDNQKLVNGWLRTGDQGHIDAEGYLFITDRLTEIINCGGHKVPPSEIDGALLEHPSVKDAAAFSIPHNSLGEAVVAAVVFEKNAGATEKELLSFVSGRLAQHKVPRHLVIADRIPRGETGKLQRRALSKYFSNLLKIDYVAPSTETEIAVSRIWQEILGAVHAGINDNIFLLGGDSITAAQILSRINNTFNIQLPVQAMFDSPTIAALSEQVDAEHRSASVTRPGPASRESAVPLSSGQQRLWFLDQLDPGSAAYNISRALRLRGDLRPDILEQCIREIVRRHEVLRTVIVSEKGAPVQRINPSAGFNLGMLDLSGLPDRQRDTEARNYAKQEAYRPFDLAAGPLLRAVLVRLHSDEHMLILTVHHIVSDAWSIGILCRELSLLYEAFLNGKPSPLPELSFQYADYAVWQLRWLEGGKCKAELEFWRDQLSDITPLILPADRPRPAVPSFNGARHTFQLSGGLTNALRDLGRKERVTMFMTLLTAFQVLLHRYTGQDDIVVGIPVANRNQSETEGLIGFFVNTLVLRIDASGDPVFRDLLKTSRKRLLDAYSHQDLPFEKLVEFLQPQREPGRNPLFQVGFAMQNVPFSDLRLPGLTIERTEIDDAKTKFDLEVYLAENAEGVRCSFVYSTDLFNADTIQRMAAHYQMVLEELVADPDMRLSGTLKGNETPRSGQARQLAELWAEMLGRKSIGIHGDFFESGGDSLSASRCLLRMKSMLGISVPHEAFYQNPTVHGVISSLETIAPASAGIKAAALTDPVAAGEIPLAVCQEEIWSTQQLHPALPLFNEPFTIFIHEEINTHILEEAFLELIRRYPVLRTAFSVNNHMPVQSVANRVSWSLSITDIRQLPSAVQEAEAIRISETLARQPFDLTAPPLMRAALVQFNTQEYRLYIVLHHLIVDAVTMYSIFMPQLHALYKAGLNGNAPEVNRNTARYADYVMRQRNMLKDNHHQKHLEYWEKKLAGTPLLDLPTDRPRSSLSDFKGAFRRLSYSKELSASLHMLGRQHGATFFMVLLAAFKVLLWRYTRNDVIAVGSIDGWRSSPGLDQLAGCCMNSLVFSTELSGNPPFAELLRRVRETALHAYAHKDMPFGELAKKLGYPRDYGRHPLFRAVLVLEPAYEKAGSGWSVSQLEVQTGTSKFELAFELEERPEGIIGRVEYDTALFNADTIGRMIRHYEVLLNGIVQAPDCPVSQLPILTEPEQCQLLERWSSTESTTTNAACINELIEKQAEKTPDAAAVIFGVQELTYRELNHQANRLSRYLSAQGAAPGTKVGICLERSVEVIVSIMAVLKAGGVYVPLDPSYPPERLSFILKDSMTDILVTQEALTPLFSDHNITTVIIDFEKDKIDDESPSNPVCCVRMEDSAYIIYTSGSTGLPKGVVVSHGSIARHCIHMADHYGLDPHDRVLQFAPLNFDASLEQILPPLLAGAAVVLRDKDLWTPAELHEKVPGYGLTVVNLPPAYFHEWVRYAVHLPAGSRADTLRLIICGGDELRPETVRLWLRSLLRSSRLLNAYGPTETTITATTFEVNAKFMEKDLPSKIPIGRPLPDRKIYILDRYDNLLPAGVPGELHIGGDCLAHGYLNRSELTAEKFIPDPFSPGHGKRLYKTGDLARHLQDGNIEFLGRIDHQVKIRGFRIEPGEIEAVLGQHPGIKETVVLAREAGAGDTRLAAYAVLKPDQTTTTDEMRRFLTEKLPEYMVPSAFIVLASLPLTPSGKLDRIRLPEPDHTRPDLGNEYAAPHTPEEEVLAGLWSEVLGINQIGAHDNFFSLGGHSLLATQVMSRLRETFKVEVPLRRLFETPTITGLAAAVSKALEKRQQSDAGAAADAHEGGFPLSFAQQRLWFLNQMEPDSSAYNVLLAVQLSGKLNIDALEKSIGEILGRHEVLRTAFPIENEEPVQKICPPVAFTLRQADISRLVGPLRAAEAKRAAREELSQPFDLTSGPLLRSMLLRLGDEEHILFCTVHHIAFDAWSTGIFYREMSVLYESYTRGAALSLPELPMQYKDFSVWQRKWLQGEKLDEQVGFWKDHLRGAETLELPTDHPRPPVQTYNGAKKTICLPRELTEALQSLSRKEGATLFMILLAAFKSLLHRYTRQNDIVIGTPIANRNLAAVEKLIGFFVNSLVIRTDTSGNPSFRELLGRVRQVLIDAYTHQDLPFEKLVEELHPKRDLSRNPLFQVMVTLHNDETPDLVLSGITASRMELDDTRTRFDLEVHLKEESNGLTGGFIYNTDLFDTATIERMAAHYGRMLEGIAADPDQRLSDLPMLTDAERTQLLERWNATAMDYPGDKCVHELFQEQVEKTPESAAVIFGLEQLTYRALNEKANRLARYLRKEGVGPDMPVGICMERSLEMIICVLAVLKAGGAYVPLDPAYPEERLNFMMEDSGSRLLLTTHTISAEVTQNSARTACLDLLPDVLEKESVENLPGAPSPEQLAYVLYTSGSTGKPKGVAMPHGPLSNLIIWQTRNSIMSAGRKTLQFASLSFDVSFQEMFSTWCSGGTLVVASVEMRRDPAALLQYLNDESIERIFLPFVALRQLAEVADWYDSFPRSLKEVITAGEQLRISPSISRLFGKMGECLLYNQYGPTESHVVTAFRLPGPPAVWPSLPPIGRPISNASIYLLDDNYNPVPAGVPGEIYIGGECLARGYINRPELTDERFIANPLSTGYGARLYKTGDVGRYLTDGNIEYLGRADNQIKVRGFRIEPGEIEAELELHPAIRAAVVAAGKDRIGDNRLVAYVVLNEGLTVVKGELKNFLSKKLPGYMIPSVFTVLNQLSLTPSGKVDRKSLPHPDEEATDSGEKYLPPRNELEKLIVKTWEKFLGVRPVGVSDNFFMLGGHSLLAVQVIAEIRNSTGRNLSVIDLFRTQTVEQLAKAISGEYIPEAASSILPVRSQGMSVPLFWLNDTSLVNSLGPDQPLYVLKRPYQNILMSRYITIEQMASSFIKDLVAFRPKGPYILGGYCFWALVAMEMARQLREQGQEVLYLIMLDPSPRCLPDYVPPGSDHSGEPSLSARVSRHLGVIREIGNAQKAIYIMKKLGLVMQLPITILSAKAGKMIRQIRTAVSKLYLLTGRPMPDALVRFYFYDIYSRELMRRHVPVKYTGKVVLFNSGKNNVNIDRDWSGLSEEAVTIHILSEYGHLEMLSEAAVGVWAKRLNTYLADLWINKTIVNE